MRFIDCLRILPVISLVCYSMPDGTMNTSRVGDMFVKGFDSDLKRFQVSILSAVENNKFFVLLSN